MTAPVGLALLRGLWRQLANPFFNNLVLYYNGQRECVFVRRVTSVCAYSWNAWGKFTLGRGFCSMECLVWPGLSRRIPDCPAQYWGSTSQKGSGVSRSVTQRARNNLITVLARA